MATLSSTASALKRAPRLRALLAPLASLAIATFTAGAPLLMGTGVAAAATPQAPGAPASVVAAPGGGHAVAPASQPVGDVAPTHDDMGYWMVASNGGIFTFGDAPFYGSTGAVHLAKPIVG